MKVYIGIDPGTTSCGVAVIHPRGIITETIKYDDKTSVKRIFNIVDDFEFYYNEYFQADNAFVYCEEPYLPGKGNKTMNRFLGALEYMLFSYHVKVRYVSPKEIKAALGNGSWTKQQVAKAICEHPRLKNHANIIRNKIKEQAWDETDALAIALFGYEEVRHNAQKEDEQQDG